MLITRQNSPEPLFCAVLFRLGLPKTTMTRTGVPETDEEVREHFQKGREYSDIAKVSLIGIYECRRAMGDTCADAYIYTLRCLVDPKHPSLNHLALP